MTLAEETQSSTKSLASLQTLRSEWSLTNVTRQRAVPFLPRTELPHTCWVRAAQAVLPSPGAWAVPSRLPTGALWFSTDRNHSYITTMKGRLRACHLYRRLLVLNARSTCWGQQRASSAAEDSYRLRSWSHFHSLQEQYLLVQLLEYEVKEEKYKQRKWSNK